MPMTSTTAKATAPAAPVTPKAKAYVLRTPATSVVTAVQYLGKPDAAGQFAGNPTREDPLHQQTLVLVQTAEGGRPAFPGDWIVTDSIGNASVMKDVDFYARYVADAPVAAPAPAPVAIKTTVAPAHVLAAVKSVAAPDPAPVAPTATKPAVPTAAAKPVHDILT